MTSVLISLALLGALYLVLWFIDRRGKERGENIADKQIAENAAKLKEKQLEIANEPDASPSDVINFMHEGKL